jgi:hypothetical protein
VIMGVARDAGVEWQPRATSLRALPRLLAWLEHIEAAGRTDLRSMSVAAGSQLRSEGLVVCISDWMASDVSRSLSNWTTAGVDVIGLQVLAPEEAHPSFSGGEFTLSDVETGEELQVRLDPDAHEDYRAELLDWQEELRSTFALHGARWHAGQTDADLVKTVTHDWRASGLII